MKETILTGDRPTGRLHLGHYVGSLQNRIKMQDEYRQFIMIADSQALTDNAENPEKIRESVFDVTLDYLAVGIDPNKSVILIQSQISELSELAMYFMNLVSLSRVEQNPTVKTEIKQKKFGRGVPAGFVMYPISQAADILGFKATVVPVGEDQLPMIEQTNEIVDRFNAVYGKVFDRVKAVVPENARLPGIDGAAKMGKSLGNAIYLSDSLKEISEKVMMMYTDPAHLKVSDPGHVKGNMVFIYLDVFDPNKDEVEKLKKQYKKGGLGDVVVKKRLIGVLENLIKPIRERREELAKDQSNIIKILENGTLKAQEVVQETLEEVRRAMRLDYFG
ncbi:MAG: tryptophan--tRNA ligase [Patescibacteria group bacterium]